MLRYRKVTYQNNYSFRMVWTILRNGHGLHISCYFRQIYTIINITIPSFSGIMTTGMKYSDCCTGVISPTYTRESISFKNIYLLILGTRQYLELTGSNLGFISRSTGSVSQCLSVLGTHKNIIKLFEDHQ